MVFFNFSAQEDQTAETHYSPRLSLPTGDMEVEVLFRGQHYTFPIIFVGRLRFERRPLRTKRYLL